MDDTNLITIGCRHASGLRLRVSEWFKTPGLDEPQLREIAVYDLDGGGQHHGALPGYTRIPAEHWAKWKALNGHSDHYTSKTIFEAKGEDDAPPAPQLTAEEEQEKARAAAEQQAREQAEAEAERAARAAEEAKAEADRAAKAAAEQQEQGDGTGGETDEEPTPDAELDKLTDDELRAYVRDRGVVVDGRWRRNKLLVEAEKLKARG